MTSLAKCSMGEKLLYTAFLLLLMGIGYLMALVYLYTSHAGNDAKPGLGGRCRLLLLRQSKRHPAGRSDPRYHGGLPASR